MIIDVHAHYLPQSAIDSLVAGHKAFPSVTVQAAGGSVAFAFAGHAPTRPVMGRLRETEERFEWMRGQSIDVQLAGGWLDSFGYELPADEGADWSRFLNETAQAAAKGVAGLLPLATIPMQDGGLAARVLEEAVKAGFKGAMIGTQPKGGSGNLDDADLDPFWEAASGLGATIYLHPMFGCGDPRLLDFDMINTIGRGADTMTAVGRLVFSGKLLKYPGMKFVLSHGGGGLPFLLGRMRCNHAHHAEYGDPQASLEACYYDTVVHDTRTLEFLCAVFGADRVMMGSDYPFPIGDMEPCRIIDDSSLSAAEKADILGNVAERIFHLENCGC